MTISTRQSVVIKSCRSQHGSVISNLPLGIFTGRAYADMLWSNRPEQGHDPG